MKQIDSHERNITATCFMQGQGWIMNGTANCPPLVKRQTDVKEHCFGQVWNFGLRDSANGESQTW